MAASAASAADMSVPRPPMQAAFFAPPFTWTGFYVGANVGGGWASSTLNDSFTGASLGNSTSGFVGGGQLGYNYQMGNFVLGAEWTFDGTSLNASRTVGALQGAANTNWMTTVAARFGFAANNWLYYGKAGGGWANNSATLTNLNNGAQVSSSNTNGGWLVGAGVEWAFSPQWSTRIEYNYLGSEHLERQFNDFCSQYGPVQRQPEHPNRVGRSELSVLDERKVILSLLRNFSCL